MTGPTQSERVATVEFFGVRFVVESSVDGLVAAVLGRLPASSRPSAARRERRYVVEPAGASLMIRRGRRAPLRVPSVDAAAEEIAADLQRALAHSADGLVLVHAGAVVWKGRALVLPGRSGSGKSELVQALLRAGAEYLSDEFAVFDDRGLVHAYARPIRRRVPGAAGAWASVATLAHARSEPAEPGLIAFLRFVPGARWRPRRLSAGQTMLGLLRHTVAARRRLGLARSVLLPVAASTAAVGGARGEADEVAGRLLEELSACEPSTSRRAGTPIRAVPAIPPVYCLSVDDPARKARMKRRFAELDLPVTFLRRPVRAHDVAAAMASRGAAPAADFDPRVASIMLNHIAMIRRFVEDTDAGHGIFCEDDVRLRRTFRRDVPWLVERFDALGLDVLLLGYLWPWREADAVAVEGPSGYGIHDCDDDVWGTQMYMLSRAQAARLVRTHTLDHGLATAARRPFAADWTITREGARARVYPLLAVEEGEITTSDPAQVEFHRRCAEAQFDPARYV